MRSLQRVIAFGIVVVGLSRRVDAEATTNATCTTAFWTYNHEQQTPCLVASALLGACNAGTWVVLPISSNDSYQGPTSPGTSNACQCSTVVYSLVSACAACQDALVGTWSDWSLECSLIDIGISSFPLTIPPGVGVPAWAYQDVVVSNNWDATAAQSNNGPESSAVQSPTAIQTPGSIASATSFPSPSKHSPPNTAAIVGGAVGGVGGFALIGLLVFLVYRRKKKARGSPSMSASSSYPESRDLMGTEVSSPDLETPPPIMVGLAPIGIVHHGPPQNMKLYDPDDPSTFPGADAMPSILERPAEL